MTTQRDRITEDALKAASAILMLITAAEAARVDPDLKRGEAEIAKAMHKLATALVNLTLPF